MLKAKINIFCPGMPYAYGIEKKMLNADGISKTQHNDHYNPDRLDGPGRTRTDLDGPG